MFVYKNHPESEYKTNCLGVLYYFQQNLLTKLDLTTQQAKIQLYNAGCEQIDFKQKSQ